jgi:hypothetical protein
MLYVAMTFWLLVCVLTAWGVHRLWCGILPVKVFNALLLPGTLIALLGHILGLLVTGATVNTATLYKDGSGDPETTTDPKPRIPVIGPVIIGMLPLLACGTAIFFVVRFLGGPILARLPSNFVRLELPTTLSGVFDLLRGQISLVESLVAAVRAADFHDWKSGVFAYLLVCLTIRMAPFDGTLRGALAAIVVLGLGTAAVTSLFDVADPRVQTGQSILTLTVAALLFLLFTSLLIRGVVGLVQLLRSTAAPRPLSRGASH